MNRMKLKFLNCDYSIHEENGVVVAHSTFIWKGKKIITTGIARCNPAIFDLRAGKQLARARAERKAYIVVRNDINHILKEVNKVTTILNNSLDFYNTCIEHQDDYIAEF